MYHALIISHCPLVTFFLLGGTRFTVLQNTFCCCSFSVISSFYDLQSLNLFSASLFIVASIKTKQGLLYSWQFSLIVPFLVTYLFCVFGHGDNPQMKSLHINLSVLVLERGLQQLCMCLVSGSKASVLSVNSSLQPWQCCGQILHPCQLPHYPSLVWSSTTLAAHWGSEHLIKDFWRVSSTKHHRLQSYNRGR